MATTRRSLLGMAGAGSAALALAACAGGSTSAGGGGGGKGEEGDGSIQFWSNHPGSSKDLEQKIIDAWNKDNPDNQAKLIDGGASYEELGQKFNAALAGGGLPDLIVASDVTWFNFAFTGTTTAMDDLWKEAEVDSDDFVDTLREDYEYDGKHYGMPYSRSTTLMYFNTEVMKKAGLPTDKGPETWEQFAEWAPKILDANGGKPAIVIPDGSDYLDWFFQGIIWTFGGNYSKEWTPTFTEQGSIDAATFLQEQVAAGHIGIEKDAANAFSIGNSSGLLQSTGSLGGLKESAEFDFHTTYLPGPTPGACTGGAGIAIPEGISDERKVMAMKFADFLTSTPEHHHVQPGHRVHAGAEVRDGGRRGDEVPRGEPQRHDGDPPAEREHGAAGLRPRVRQRRRSAHRCRSGPHRDRPGGRRDRHEGPAGRDAEGHRPGHHPQPVSTRPTP